MTPSLHLELQVFRNLFVSIAEEMGIILRRTSFSPNIKERRDYSCAVYDHRAETIAMGDHMPVHLGAMPFAVNEVLRSTGLGRGDVVILNDPFRGGTHLPDITSVSAVFSGRADEPAYYLATRAHHSDVGGMTPGSMPLATEIFQEGLRIPPVKLVRAGEIDQDLLALVLSNTRTPDERRGDLQAQLAAHKVGEARMLAAAEKYGESRITEQMERLKDYTERMMRQRICEIPAGDYQFEDSLDDDGVDAKRVRIHCRLRIEDDGASVDFSNSSPQVRGGVNANLAVTMSAVMYCFRCLVEDDIPYNAGLLRPITVVTRPNTVVDAKAPASVAAGNVETSQRITDTLLGALHQALPGKIPAASSGTMNNLTLGGTDPRLARAFAYYETIAGGMGAGPASDGLHGVHTHMTNSLNTPTEALEHFYPLRVRQYRLRRGSGGAGKRRGGDGIIREIEFLADTDVALLADRRKSAPYGLDGGSAGHPGVNELNGKPVPSKGSFRAKAGDRLRIETPGGGGYGSSGEAD